MGRTNRNVPSPQRMNLGNESDVMSLGRSASSTSGVGAPFSSWTATTYSPRSSARTSSRSTGTPWARAKPSAARVGFPSASNATAFVGPTTSRRASACRSARPSTTTANRRGVARVRMLLKRSLCSWSRRPATVLRSSIAGGM